MKTQILLREKSNSWLEHFPSRTTIYLPVLDTIYTNPQELRRILAEQSDTFSSVVITSQRAVNAYTMAFVDSLASKRYYVVGPATTSSLKAIHTDMQEATIITKNNVQDLLQTMLEDSYASYSLGNVLVLQGDKNDPILVASLLNKGIHCLPVRVYETIPRKEGHILSELRQLDGSNIKWIVFFSPSGLSSSLSSLRQLGVIDNVKLAAIGKTTAAALTNAGLHISAIAEQPTPGHLSEAMRQAI